MGRVLDRLRHRDDGGLVEDDLTTPDRLVHQGGIPNIPFDKIDPVLKMGDVATVAGRQVVHYGYPPSVGHQLVNQVGSDEAGTAGDQCVFESVHGASSFQVKIAGQDCLAGAQAACHDPGR
jgi:hypothetical protein